MLDALTGAVNRWDVVTATTRFCFLLFTPTLLAVEFESTKEIGCDTVDVFLTFFACIT
jgi:hypothetical protein